MCLRSFEQAKAAFSTSSWIQTLPTTNGILAHAKGDADSNGTVVASAYLEGGPQRRERTHSARQIRAAALCRIAWLPDGTLLLTTGDGFDFREQAQNLATYFGKMIRMNPDGSALLITHSEHPFVFSYGHRNPQGPTVAQDGTIYEHEHGPVAVTRSRPSQGKTTAGLSQLMD